jgi:hypothetical protein
MFPEQLLVFGSGALRDAVAHVLDVLCPTSVLTFDEMVVLQEHLAPSTDPTVQNVPSILWVDAAPGGAHQVERFIVALRSRKVRGTIYFLVAPSVFREASRLPIFKAKRDSHVLFTWGVTLAEMLNRLAHPTEIWEDAWRQFCAEPAAWDAITACVKAGFAADGLALIQQAVLATRACRLSVEHGRRRQEFLEKCDRLSGPLSCEDDYAERIRNLRYLLREYAICGERSVV